MISLTEIKPIKLPGLSSIKVEFNYRKEIVDVLHQIPNAVYHKKLFCWEIPVTSLAMAIDYLSNYDSLDILLLPDVEQEKIVDFELDNFKTTPYKYQMEGINFGLNKNRWLLLDAPGLGKAVTLDTRVATPEGFVPINNIHKGDLVYDDLGNPVKVLDEYLHDNLNMYDVTFSNGHTIRCCEDHLWKIEFSHKRNMQSEDYIYHDGVYKTSELLNFSERKFKDIKMPLCKPVKYAEKEFLLHPYLLGVILGDGHVNKHGHTNIWINNNDLDISEKIEHLVPKGVALHKVKTVGGCTDFSFIKNCSGKYNPMNKIMKNLGLSDVTASDKFIPKEYLYGSIEQRKELIRGLLDTDGSGGAVVCYTSASKQLCEDLIELIESLGGWCRLSTKHVKKYNKDYYTVTIRYDNLQDLFYTNRKKSISLESHRWSKVVRIKSIIPAGVHKGKCITVDSPNHLYLLEHYIITHNTLQMIYLAQELKRLRGIKHCLIICGINTLKFNWKKEILTHSNLSCKILGERITKKGKLKIGSVQDRVNDLKKPIDEFFVVTNIETLRNNDIIKQLKSDKINKFDMMVFDEIHTARSPSSQQGKNLLKLSADYQVGLTGTLLTNSPLDVYVPLKWLGVDNSTYTNFKYYYCNYTGKFNNILTGYKNLEVLKDELDKVSLRRTKDLLDLPPKTIIHETIDMDDKQEKFYNNIVEGSVEQVDKVELKPDVVLAMITRWRQATSCPSILTTENIQSAKINRAKDLTQQIVSNGGKVVIFSVYKETLNTIKNELSEYNPLLCTGDVPDVEISQNIENFQNNENAKVLLATTSKLGTGVTLTSASYMIFIDTPFTAAQCKQCEDRIHRIGSKDPVFIYYLWTNDTIDLRVKEIIEDKEAIADFIIDDKITKNSIESLRKYIIDME